MVRPTRPDQQQRERTAAGLLGGCDFPLALVTVLHLFWADHMNSPGRTTIKNFSMARYCCADEGHQCPPVSPHQLLCVMQQQNLFLPVAAAASCTEPPMLCHSGWNRGVPALCSLDDLLLNNTNFCIILLLKNTNFCSLDDLLLNIPSDLSNRAHPTSGEEQDLSTL